MKNLTFEQGMEIADKIDQEYGSRAIEAGITDRIDILSFRVCWLQATIAYLLSDPDYKQRLITKYK